MLPAYKEKKRNEKGNGYATHQGSEFRQWKMPGIMVVPIYHDVNYNLFKYKHKLALTRRPPTKS